MKEIDVAVKFLSEERDNGKFKSMEDIPDELVKMIGEAKMHVTDYKTVDELRDYMKTFVSLQLQNLMRIGEYDDNGK